ncbi:hypothetical protein L915_00478 [Phytophthora nicotianae]|uniref:Uncharacterized protein n=2 Tax=Phytophthora nicotianae TaxID=4792 RepID=V9G1C7_PHYNI|nr:hypothetical protein F443_00506 [Phytophthora nicotianae P1569]ETK96893.1 hypothetical protein L915_00478 [Phytophthora nicotianae]
MDLLPGLQDVPGQVKCGRPPIFLSARCGGIGAIPHRHVLSGRVLNEYAELHSMEQHDSVRAIQN